MHLGDFQNRLYSFEDLRRTLIIIGSDIYVHMENIEMTPITNSVYDAFMACGITFYGLVIIWHC